LCPRRLPAEGGAAAVLDAFAPDFTASLFRDENRVFMRPENMERLPDGLRLAGAEAT
jgi:hypothetical protein